MAIELAVQGIRVNVLSPGTVRTNALDAFPDKDARLQEAIETFSPLTADDTGGSRLRGALPLQRRVVRA